VGTLALNQARFRLLAHTADIGLEATAATCEELFIAAAEGFKAMVFGDTPVQPAVAQRIEVLADDLPALLVAWLNEILYLCETTGLVPERFRIEHLDERHLSATVMGETFDPTRHSVERMAKAVTYHKLTVEERVNGWYARVYIDL